MNKLSKQQLKIKYYLWNHNILYNILDSLEINLYKNKSFNQILKLIDHKYGVIHGFGSLNIWYTINITLIILL